MQTRTKKGIGLIAAVLAVILAAGTAAVLVTRHRAGGGQGVIGIIEQVVDEWPAAEVVPFAPLAPEPEPALAPIAAAPAVEPAAAPVAAPVAAAPAPASAPVAPAPVTIRVDLDRVDRLINVVGELVIQQAMLSQRVLESGLARSSGIALGLEDLELLTREIQDSVMAIRAQPVKSVFQRMPRLVREVADMVSKQVRLVTAGEDTEVDKTVVERLAEPITHMLRNAIDHGLETPEERVAAGKPAEGTVRLAALHRSGRIVIEISDDGRGINRERVRKIAVDKGLIAADAPLTDEQIDNLIFAPGFSTAAVVSDISGRGVGMDVVKRSIQALGGRISISSVPGKGSTFTLSLPLTLAVLDGMVVAAAEQRVPHPRAEEHRDDCDDHDDGHRGHRGHPPPAAKPVLPRALPAGHPLPRRPHRQRLCSVTVPVVSHPRPLRVGTAPPAAGPASSAESPPLQLGRSPPADRGRARPLRVAHAARSGW